MAKAKTPPMRSPQVEMWPLIDLKEFENNARTHPPEQIEAIAQSMKEFGFTIPILAAEDGTIIAGHGRLEAARVIGMAEVPVIVAEGWTDEQRRAYTLADNRLAETSDWDVDKLALELDFLNTDGFDLGAIGFDEATLDALTSGSFAPTLVPGMAVGEVTGEDVAKAAEELDASGERLAKQNLIEVTCPHCGKEYDLDKNDLV